MHMLNPIIMRNELSSTAKEKLKSLGRSPILNREMFIQYTSDQIRLMENISNKIKEVKMFISAFKFPCALSRTLNKESFSSIIRKKKCLVMEYEPITIDSIYK